MTMGVFTCSILSSIVTILVSIVVILTSIEPILEKFVHLKGPKCVITHKYCHNTLDFSIRAILSMNFNFEFSIRAISSRKMVEHFEHKKISSNHRAISRISLEKKFEQFRAFFKQNQVFFFKSYKFCDNVQVLAQYS